MFVLNKPPIFIGILGGLICVFGIFFPSFFFEGRLYRVLMLSFQIIGLTLFLYSISYKNFETTGNALLMAFLASCVPFILLGLILPNLGIIIGPELRLIIHAIIALVLLRGAIFNPRF